MSQPVDQIGSLVCEMLLVLGAASYFLYIAYLILFKPETYERRYGNRKLLIGLRLSANSETVRFLAMGCIIVGTVFIIAELARVLRLIQDISF